ncbi:hypothetical protein [Nocardioides sp.]|uniref:hypothetical protein n=1 Tax=Nocardioides sp. TaxID=35761 RepID=UPI002B27544D|nr:hypothetical protein [Nocardioides sp.]
MTWEEELFGFLDDLEHQAGALFEADRDLEVADRSRTEYQQVSLASRLQASLDDEVGLDVVGVGVLRGRLERVCESWCLLRTASGQEWLVPLPALTAVDGAADRSVPEVAWSPLTRLGLGSALRRLGDAGERCLVHRRDGGRHEGVPARVGADFLELVEGEGVRSRVRLVAFAAIAAVQSP